MQMLQNAMAGESLKYPTCLFLKRYVFIRISHFRIGSTMKLPSPLKNNMEHQSHNAPDTPVREPDAVHPCAVNSRPYSQDQDWLGELSPRQRDVFGWICEGKRDREIAQILGVSYRTVTVHVRSILSRLWVENRTCAAMMAARVMRNIGNGITEEVVKYVFIRIRSGRGNALPKRTLFGRNERPAVGFRLPACRF